MLALVLICGFGGGSPHGLELLGYSIVNGTFFVSYKHKVTTLLIMLNFKQDVLINASKKVYQR